jgi:hypothetical protein
MLKNHTMNTFQTVKDIGTVSENIDVLKRDYSWLNNFMGNVWATTKELSAGLDGFVDYGIRFGSGNPALNVNKDNYFANSSQQMMKSARKQGIN